ncbi:MAG: hypothetical protein ACR2P6_04360 [Gammaproteobacteria bacterium]
MRNRSISTLNSAVTNKSNLRKPAAINRLAELAGIFLVLSIVVWIGMAPGTPESSPGSGFMPPAAEALPCVQDEPGYLAGDIYGAIKLHIDWRGTELLCSGQNKPDKSGLRLIFKPRLDEGQPGITLVIGIKNVQPGQTSAERPANITSIDEQSGSFFSTQEQERCWTTVDTLVPLEGTLEQSYRIEGELYCAGAIAEISGSRSVTLGDIRYSGRLTTNDIAER